MARSRRSGGMETLAVLVAKVYPAEQPEEARAMRIFAAWRRVVSERIFVNARPVAFRQGVLNVNTTTAAWANALSFESSRIIAKLRGRVSDVPVERITFRMGKLPELPELVREQGPPPRLMPIEALPEPIARELARIADDGLRAAIARAVAASIAEPVRDAAANGAQKPSDPLGLGDRLWMRRN